MFGVPPFLSVHTVSVTLGASVTGLLALWLYRQHTEHPWSNDTSTDYYQDLIRPFLIMLVVFVCGSLSYAVIIVNGSSELTFGWGFPLAFLISVPWCVFALRYAGRGHLLTPLRIALFSIAALVVTTLSWILLLPSLFSDGLTQIATLGYAFLVLSLTAVIFVASGFVLLSSYRHGSHKITSGMIVVLLIAVPFLIGQLTTPNLPTFSITILTAGHVATAGIFVLSVTRYDVLSDRPGTGSIGERRVVEKMDEAVFIVDRDGAIVRANETVTQLFGNDTEGERFADLLGCSVTELSERETIERWTERGRIQFDPRVSTLTNRQDHTLGFTVTLLDVTDREIRQQRIQVLNRILRHNLRNNLDVIIANTVAGIEGKQVTDTHLEAVLDAAEELDLLSADARRIEQIITTSDSSNTAVDFAGTVEKVVDNVINVRSETDVTVSIDVPVVTIRTDERLLKFMLKNVIENAIEHNDSSEPRVDIRGSTTEHGVRIEVADNGPGIPKSERAVLEAGEESSLAHATSLGLWSVKWTVETMGGDLSLGNSDDGGATVRIDLPMA